MPTLFEFGELTDSSLENIKPDVFVAACGSDKRAYTGLRMLDPNTQVILLDYEERKMGLKCDDPYFDYRDLFDDAALIECSIFEPEIAMGKIIGEFNALQKSTIMFDVSCTTNPYMFTMFRVLKDKLELERCCAIYTEPESYIFAKGKHSLFRSSSGTLELQEITGFPGVSSRNKREILVVLLGFDGERSQFVLDQLSPDETIAFSGLPAFLPKYKDVSIVNNEKLVSSIGFENLKFVNANSPFRLINELADLRHSSLDSVFSIVPLGTKPMNLGACLFALRDNSVRIVYPSPNEYAKSTTHSPWRTWFYNLPLAGDAFTPPFKER